MWLTLPFYDFCGVISVAVNSVYKLQFFTFIFAVLLLVLSRLLIMSITTTFFKMAAAAILDFRNFKILTVGTFKRVELHLRAKFCQNRSNRGQDMAIFRFFIMAAAAILDFQNFKFLTAGTVKRSNCTSVTNFVKIG